MFKGKFRKLNFFPSKRSIFVFKIQISKTQT